jgi:hypothetical protein
MQSIIATHIGIPARRGGRWRDRLARWCALHMHLNPD